MVPILFYRVLHDNFYHVFIFAIQIKYFKLIGSLNYIIIWIKEILNIYQIKQERLISGDIFSCQPLPALLPVRTRTGSRAGAEV